MTYDTCGDASDGPLSPGCVGIVVSKDESDLPFRVEYEGRSWWYARDALVVAKEPDFYIRVVSCTTSFILCSSRVSFKCGSCIEFVGTSFGGLTKQPYYVHEVAADCLSFSISCGIGNVAPLKLISGLADAFVRVREAASFVQWAPADIPIISRESDFLITPFNPRLKKGSVVYFAEGGNSGSGEKSTYIVNSVETADKNLKFSLRDSDSKSEAKCALPRGKHYASSPVSTLQLTFLTPTYTCVLLPDLRNNLEFFGNQSAPNQVWQLNHAALTWHQQNLEMVWILSILIKVCLFLMQSPAPLGISLVLRLLPETVAFICAASTAWKVLASKCNRI
jgi:hypothetical protein